MQVVKANDLDYLTFQDLVYSGGKLLKDWTDDEYKEYMEHVNTNRAFGWNSYVVLDHMKVVYERTTIQEFINSGSTPIPVEVNYEEKTQVKHSVNVKGELSISSTNKGKELSKGLNSSLKAEYAFVYDNQTKLDYKIKYNVDVDTRVRIYIAGTGYITNGVALKKAFWITWDHGGFEIFVSSGEYFRFVKQKI
jgi:hypothetical protein